VLRVSGVSEAAVLMFEEYRSFGSPAIGHREDGAKSQRIPAVTLDLRDEDLIIGRARL
jgi:hypothetical protein